MVQKGVITQRRLPGSLPLFRALFFGSWLLLATGAHGLLPEHPRISQSPEPDWRHDVAFDLESTASTDGALDATFLMTDRQIRIPARGPSADSERYVYRIESRSALEEWSSWQIDFDPSYQDLAVHHLRVYRAGAWADRLESSRASLLHREDDLHRQIYDQRLTLVLIFDDVRPGDVIDLAYTRSGDNPVFRGKYSNAASLRWSRDLARHYLALEVAPSRRLQVRVLGDGPEPRYSESPDGRSWVWDLHDIPAVDFEYNTPAEITQYAFAQFSEFESWSEVADWALPIYEAAFEASTELREVAERLLGEHPDPESRLVAARDWVQGELRYFAVLMGKHSHAPHRPSEILRRRYGDCKDKSTLLVSLLRLLDIKAYPAFVRTDLGDGLESWLPSPTAFDHAIVLARLDGREVWIDPTLTYQGGHLGNGEQLVVPDYGQGLVIEPGTTGLRKIPDDQTRPGKVTAVYRYEIEEEAKRSTRIEIVTRYDRGTAESIRRLLSATTPKDLLEDYVELYTTETIRIEAREPLEIHDDRRENLLHITERYTATYHSSDTSDKTLLDTLPLQLANDLPIPGLEELQRTHAFALPFPMEREERIELLVPPNFVLEPVETREQTDWFDFSVTSEALSAEPGADTEPPRTGLALQYRLSTRTDRVPADRVGEYREAAQRLGEYLGYSIWDQAIDRSSLARQARRGFVVAFVALVFLGFVFFKLLQRYALL